MPGFQALKTKLGAADQMKNTGTVLGGFFRGMGAFLSGAASGDFGGAYRRGMYGAEYGEAAGRFNAMSGSQAGEMVWRQRGGVDKTRGVGGRFIGKITAGREALIGTRAARRSASKAMGSGGAGKRALGMYGGMAAAGYGAYRLFGSEDLAPNVGFVGGAAAGFHATRGMSGGVRGVGGLTAGIIGSVAARVLF